MDRASALTPSVKQVRETTADIAMISGCIGACVVGLHQTVLMYTATTGSAVLLHLFLGTILPLLVLLLGFLVALALDDDCVDRWNPKQRPASFKPSLN